MGLASRPNGNGFSLGPNLFRSYPPLSDTCCLGYPGCAQGRPKNACGAGVGMPRAHS